jgi:hypothetical protein
MKMRWRLMSRKSLMLARNLNDEAWVVIVDPRLGSVVEEVVGVSAEEEILEVAEGILAVVEGILVVVASAVALVQAQVVSAAALVAAASATAAAVAHLVAAALAAPLVIAEVAVTVV